MADSNVTFRLRGIPSQYSTKNAVQELVGRTLSIHPDTRFDVHSVAANPLEPTSRVATISFQVIPTSLSDRSKKEWVLEPQGDWYSDDIDGWRKPLVFDTHFSGFTPLQSTKQEDCEVDLIALSGLGGHAFGSFKQKNGPFMWLRDALPGDIPTARILIYGYNTTTVQSSSFQNLSDLGRALQTDIREISEPYRPIIFIGHSLGGLVIKQAIAKMSEDRYDQDVSILQSITAFIFFGVPHQGMAVGSLVPLMGDQPNRALLESLGRNSDLLKRLQRDFDRAFGTEVPKVVSYFETITSPTAIKSEEKWELSGPPDILVDPVSATFGSTDQHPFDRNHSELVKFTHPYDELYTRVQVKISQLVSIAGHAISKPASGTLDDTLSIASGAIELVSFGLTACKSIISFYGIHKDRDEETRGLVRNSEELRVVLEATERHIPQLQHSHQKLAESVAASFIGELVKSLNSLSPTVANSMGKAKDSEDFKENLRTLFSRAADPLRRETILDLNRRVSDCRDSLSVAITAIELARTAQRVYTSDGENIRFRLPEGFRDGAPYAPLRSQGNRLDQTYGQLAMHNDNGWIHFSLEDETSSCTLTERTKDSSPLPVCTHTGNDDIQSNKWPEGEHYEIVPMNAQGMSLNLWRGSHEPRTPVRLYPRNPLRTNSLWEIVDAGRGEHHIVSVNSGLYLCAEGFDIRKKIFGDVTGPDKINCRWNILPAGNGSYYITNVDADFYLNVAGSHSHAGSIVILWRPETGLNSQFMFKRATRADSNTIT